MMPVNFLYILYVAMVVTRGIICALETPHTYV